MSYSTAKYTLFNLILVLIIQQYLSVQTHGNKFRRSKRAIVEDSPGSNQTENGVSTPVFNSSLTSAERMEQLTKLRDAELMLRKNLKEKGKEYENQLYENWPKILSVIKDPSILEKPEMKNLLEYAFRLKMDKDQIASAWSEILAIIKEQGGPMIQSIIDAWKDGETLPPELYKLAPEDEPMVGMLLSSLMPLMKDSKTPQFFEATTSPIRTESTKPETTRRKMFF